MFDKLKGHLPLADMISSIIDDSRSKIAAAESEEKDEKSNPFFAKKPADKKEKKEEKEEPKQEKKASAIDFNDVEEVEKLASALDQVANEFLKEADKQEKGGESAVGGESLPVMSPVAGKQPYKKDTSAKHSVPASTGLQSGGPGAKASTQVPNDASMSAIATYPKKGVMKTAAEAVMAKMKADAEEAAGTEAETDEVETEEEAVETAPEAKDEKPKAASVQALEAAVEKMAGTKVAEFPPGKGAPPFGKKDDKKKVEAKGDGKGEEGKEEKKDEGEKDKKASPVDFILSKMAESTQGGMDLTSKSGDGPKPPSGGGREMISSNTAPVSATKAKAKAPQKKLMSQVLTEPMQSKAHDSKVSENLRNAAKGGVKIAAARELLQKIASEGCTCDGKGECKYCKMKKSMEKKSMGGGMPMNGKPMPSSPMV